MRCFPHMNVSLFLRNPYQSLLVLGIESKDIKSIQWYQLLGEISILLDA